MLWLLLQEVPAIHSYPVVVVCSSSIWWCVWNEMDGDNTWNRPRPETFRGKITIKVGVITLVFPSWSCSFGHFHNPTFTWQNRVCSNASAVSCCEIAKMVNLFFRAACTETWRMLFWKSWTEMSHFHCIFFKTRNKDVWKNEIWCMNDCCTLDNWLFVCHVRQSHNQMKGGNQGCFWKMCQFVRHPALEKWMTCDNVLETFITPFVPPSSCICYQNQCKNPAHLCWRKIVHDCIWNSKCATHNSIKLKL